MEIDDALISRLEKLARLRMSPQERNVLKKDFGNILEMVEKLQELDVDGVEPLVYLNDAINRPRADEIAHQVDPAAALRNAPDREGDNFRVPKVIDL